jgi:hypothetical protein
MASVSFTYTFTVDEASVADPAVWAALIKMAADKVDINTLLDGCWLAPADKVITDALVIAARDELDECPTCQKFLAANDPTHATTVNEPSGPVDYNVCGECYANTEYNDTEEGCSCGDDEKCAECSPFECCDCGITLNRFMQITSLPGEREWFNGGRARCWPCEKVVLENS